VSTPELIVYSDLCADWTSAEEIELCHEPVESSPDYTVGIGIATNVLFALSGRQFTGGCERTVRPCRTSHRCREMLWWGGSGWYSDGRPACGCRADSRVGLAGYVRGINEVTIDGVAVDPAVYRVDSNRWLTRLNDLDGTARGWPTCQDLSAPDGEPGSFVVSYQWGRDVPLEGRAAASELAWEVYLACLGSDSCSLPAGVTRLVRQGVTIEKQELLAFGQGRTGLRAVDLFLGSVNPSGLRRAPLIINPDLSPARKLG
jgi:hypothetical protein